jgi:hypothetical protein
MRRQNVLFSIIGLCLVGLVAPTGCAKKKFAEGQLCKDHKECKDSLKCVNRRCTDFSGSHPACKWSLDCLKQLAEKLPKDGVGYEISRFYKTLSGAPYKSDCIDMPSRIAQLLNNRPWEWKGICKAPPVDGVKNVEDKSSPFEILEKSIKMSMIPGDEKPEIHTKHSAYPELCKAWAKFKLRRNFQGWVKARVYEQINCQAATEEAKKADPKAKPKCETRLYKEEDRRYLPLHPAGSEFSWNFYFSTPPEVCKKPNLSELDYPKGCYCLGIDTEKFELEFEDDPFLFHDEMAKPRVKSGE